MRAAGALLLAVLAAPLAAQPAERVRVGLIIDDLGNSLDAGTRTVRLPGAVACAVLPHTTHARELAALAHAAGKEVILHLPMEAREAAEPGPGQIDARMPPLEVRATLDYDLSTVPHAIGINNHMGSLLTTDRAAMTGLMRELRLRQLFFIDSRTAVDSIAAATAQAQGIPVLARDVFLDNDPAADAVAAQLTRLERLARRRGYALGIGHPYPATLAALEQWLPQLAARGIELVPLTTRLVQLNPEAKPWHASWSH
ncbi:MAG: divergent polysaccharide deacetylase family protein [Chromatiales bacterium]|nr:divergent polysaccharide deacetylase family protein [Chromatiales bacterium]